MHPSLRGRLRVTTAHSRYEIDTTNRRVRRLASRHAPTQNQGWDSAWHSYADVRGWVGEPLTIVWGYDEYDDELVARTTTTTPIRSLRPVVNARPESEVIHLGAGYGLDDGESTMDGSGGRPCTVVDVDFGSRGA